MAQRNWDDTIGDSPMTFIQWKGTDVCMDWHCPCGTHNHLDSDFAYSIECYKCGTVFEVGSRVALRATKDKLLIEHAKRSETGKEYNP